MDEAAEAPLPAAEGLVAAVAPMEEAEATARGGRLEPIILFGFEHRADRFPWSSPVLANFPALRDEAFFARLRTAFCLEVVAPIRALRDARPSRWPEKVQVFRLSWRWPGLRRTQEGQ
jgi:hypothetical protein